MTTPDILHQEQPVMLIEKARQVLSFVSTASMYIENPSRDTLEGLAYITRDVESILKILEIQLTPGKSSVSYFKSEG